MAKDKSQKGTFANKALYSRISYLYQAAAYLAAVQTPDVTVEQTGQRPTGSRDAENHTNPTPPHEHVKSSSGPISRQLLRDLRGVSLKMQIRLSPAMKHTICKRCDSILIDGSSCTNEIENKSKGGKKPWADVWVRKCNECGLERRFPVAVERQARRPYRILKDNAVKNG